MVMLTLKVRGPKGVVSISIDESASFRDLKSAIAEKLDLDDEDGFDILAGYPPGPIKIEDDALIMGSVSNNESIRIQPKELSGVQAQGTAAKKKRGAKAVTKDPTRPSTSSQPLTFGSKIATLHPTTIRKSSPVSSQPKQKRRRLSKSDMAGNEGDICEHLIQAVSGQKGTRSKILRKVFRDAVSLQYNSTKAISRLNAVYSGQYRLQGEDHVFTLQNPSQNSLPIATKLHVTFHRGAGARGTFEETVDLIPPEMLISLIKLPVIETLQAKEDDDDYTDREILKPINLAKSSPRIFWSLVFHHGPNMIHTIQQILREHVHPDMTFDWLLDRKRELSEKAKENLAQKQQQEERRKQNKRKKKTGPVVEGDTANAPIITTTAAVKEQVETEQAQPIISELVQKEIIDGEWDSFQIDEIVPAEYVSCMTKLLSASSLFALASYEMNSNTRTRIDAITHEAAAQSVQPAITSENMAEKIPEQQIHHSNISEEQIDWWIARAQSACALYLWHRICGQGSVLLCQLLSFLRIRVPQELLLWQNAHEALYEGMVKMNPTLSTTCFDWPHYLTATAAPFDVEKAQWMVHLSRDWLVAYPWMQTLSAEELFGDWDEIDSDDMVNDSWVPEWIFGDTVGSTEYMMKRCRVIVREGDEEEEEEAEEEEKADGVDEEGEKSVSGKEEKEKNRLLTEAGKIYWENGTVIGYLPPTEDEPMALWKVKLDVIKPPKQSSSSSSSSSSTATTTTNTMHTTMGRFADLELHELQEAIHAYDKQQQIVQ